VFTYETQIFLRQTDAAGVLFFGEQFSLAADAYQAFLVDIGISTRAVFDAGDYRIPIVHAEADYHAPLRVNDPVTIEVTVSRLGSTSFTTDYQLLLAGRSVGTARCVHVVIDAATGKKRELPEPLRVGLLRHLVDPS